LWLRSQAFGFARKDGRASDTLDDGMPKSPRRLPYLRLATPCDKRWEDLAGGGEQVRFCASCEKRVFNLSNMTTAEGEALLAKKRAGLCVFYEKGRDGAPLSANQRGPSPPLPSSSVALAAAALIVLSAACGPSEESREEKNARIEVQIAESRALEQAHRDEERIAQARGRRLNPKTDRFEAGGLPVHRADPCRPPGTRPAKGTKIRVLGKDGKPRLVRAPTLPLCKACDPNDPLCGL
jgi:hypothetical protein